MWWHKDVKGTHINGRKRQAVDDRDPFAVFAMMTLIKESAHPSSCLSFDLRYHFDVSCRLNRQEEVHSRSGSGPIRGTGPRELKCVGLCPAVGMLMLIS